MVPVFERFAKCFYRYIWALFPRRFAAQVGLGKPPDSGFTGIEVNGDLTKCELCFEVRRLVEAEELLESVVPSLVDLFLKS